MLNKYYLFEKPNWDYFAIITVNSEEDLNEVILPESNFKDTLEKKALKVYVYDLLDGSLEIDQSKQLNIKEISFHEAFGYYCHSAIIDIINSFKTDIKDLYHNFINYKNDLILYDM